MKNLLYKIFRPRNILILQLILVLILIVTVRFSPNISFSSLAEEYVPIVAPWIYTEHLNKSIRLNDNDISTVGWRSGCYVVDYVESNAKRTKDVAFVVVTNPQQKGDIRIKLSTNCRAFV